MHSSAEPIAIIGMTGRFPGAATVEEFWSNLISGVESIRTLSPMELQAAGVNRELAADSRYVPRGGFIEGREYFDARFFGYSPREAEIMDPQHRVFLECAWEVLESAGYDSEAYPGRIGVLASSTTRAWALYVLSNLEIAQSLTSVQIAGIAGATDHLATRTAFKLNLSGPAASVQTSCSSSMVAICFACQALLDRQCDMIIAGGVSVMYQQSGYLYEESGVASPDGHCRVFDAAARGTVAGEGVGAVLLKRLSDATADGDNIIAVIRGWSVNNDGSSKMSYFAPSVPGQTAAVIEAQRFAGVDAETIGYVEAHGTGTRIGDPIEIAALTQAFQSQTPKRGFCGIGSVKTNIGHLDAAAGVAGLIKTALILQHGVMPATLYYQDPNPEIDFAASPFYVIAETQKWRHEQRPRRAGVSSFGIGGTNAHVVIEEPPVVEERASQSCGGWALLPISARSSTARAAAIARLAVHFSTHPDICLDDVAYTLQIGRRPFQLRTVVVASNVAEAVRCLEEAGSDGVAVHAETALRRATLAFILPVIPGSIRQAWQQMFAAHEVFRTEVDHCFQILAGQCGMRLEEELGIEPTTSTPKQTPENDCLASFIYQYAMARLWIDKGVRPSAVLGEGVGIFVAAHLAGILDLQDSIGLALCYARRPGGEDAQLDDSLALAAAAAAKNHPVIPLNSFEPREGRSPDEVFTRGYWKGLLESRSLLSECVHFVSREGRTILLEISPYRMGYETSGLRGDDETFQCDERSLLGVIGALWVRGISIDWTKLHHGSRRRVQLPTYPFERERFWIEPGNLQLRHAPPPAKSCKPHFAVPVWRQSIDPETTKSRAESWLIFADDKDFSACFVDYVRQIGGHAITVSVYGDPRCDFCVSPTRPEKFRELASTLLLSGEIPPRILYACNFSQSPDTGAGSRAFLDLVYFLQAVHERELRTAPRTLLVLSSHSQQVTGMDTLNPARAVAHGLGEAVADEYPQVSLRFIDAAYPNTAADRQQLIEQIFSESNRTGEDKFVAFRGPRRWTADYQAVELPRNMEPILPSRGVCFIIGGLGGVGLAIAEHLALRSNAKLALTCASPFPARHEWGSWLKKHDQHDKTSVRIRKLMEIESLGSELLTATVDAADSQSMHEFLLQVRQRLGPLNGVIHAAGVPGGKVIQLLTGVHTDAVWRPKIQALDVLCTTLQDETKLEWIVLCSSLMAIAGGLGRADYAAANSYLDAFAQQQHGGKVRILSVNWDTWVGTGMSSRALTTGTSSETNTAGLQPAEALQSLADALRSGLPQVVISESNLSEMLESRKQLRSSAHREKVCERQFVGLNGSPVESFNPTSVEKILMSTWEELLGLSPISRDDNFFELGGDSIVGLEMATRMQEVGLQLSPRDIFTAPTLAELVKLVKPLENSGSASAPAVISTTAPGSPPIELILKQIWKDLLAVPSVNLNDDFFELGGDSVVGLQMAARLRELGYYLSPENIFDASVLSDLARLIHPIKDAKVPTAAGNSLRATQPLAFRLSPIQEWFFESAVRNPHHFNQSVFLEVGNPSLSTLADGVALLVSRHQMLSARFGREGDAWRQYVSPSGESQHYSCIDLSLVNDDNRRDLIESLTAAIQGGLHLERGPVFRAVFFDLGPARSARLLLVAHHLVVDAASWATLLEELQTLCAEGINNHASSANLVLLRPIPVSYSEFVAYLPQLVPIAERSLSHWKDVVQVPVLSLPRDLSGHNQGGDACVFEIRIERDETERLTCELTRRFRTPVETLLLGAVGMALAAWTGQTHLRLHVEGSARVNSPTGLDLSRTVGWFTTLYPLVIDIVPGTELREIVADLERKMRHSGLEYGLLRYLSENPDVRASLRPSVEPEISFVYLGAGSMPASSFGPAPESRGPANDPDEPRSHLIDIVAEINSGQLRMSWVYSKSLHEAHTVQSLAESTIRILRTAAPIPVGTSAA
jgi:non-ribosomal peptide synthase protein (TIGR01720 family)